MKKVKDIYKENKKALSEMVAYVILISIALGIALSVFSWMVIIAKGANQTVECKEGTSVTLESVNYNPADNNLFFSIKNNGRFNVNGVIIAVGNNSSKFIPYYFKPPIGAGTTRGHYDFGDFPLSPGDTKNDIKFYAESEYSCKDRTIRIVQIQPYIINSKNKKIVCKNLFKDDTVNINLGTPTC
ncbi:MAG: hypothetical protein QXW97_03445 [Candidatus Pacearchaeota archaeon]